jgi:hypothetical protein
MARYANRTKVTTDRSINEIEELLRKRYGAKSFVYGIHNGQIALIFEMNDRRIRFVTPLPQTEDYRLTATGRKRGDSKTVQKAYDQGVKQIYRALLLSIKGKLESAASRIETFEDAFMAQTVMPNGKTMSEWAQPQIAAAYKSGHMPPLMIEAQGGS